MTILREMKTGTLKFRLSASLAFEIPEYFFFLIDKAANIVNICPLYLMINVVVNMNRIVQFNEYGF